MNAAGRAARAGRNLVLALVAGAAVLVVIVMAYMLGKGGAGINAEPSGTPQATAVQSATREETGVAPTGCIGGTSRDNAMLLRAQNSASATTFGGVEVAASFFRWSVRAPQPTKDDVRDVGSIFVPSDATTAKRNLIAEYTRHPNSSGGLIPDRTRFYLSTVGARWAVTAPSGDAQMRVSILAPFVIDDALSPTKTVAEAFDMRLVDGRWRVVGLARADAARLASGGTAFTAGC